MYLTDLPPEIVESITAFISQDELVALARTCKTLNSIVSRKLYDSICIRPDPIFHSDLWFIDTNWSTIAGYRAVIKRSDQNDYFLYQKVRCLMDTLDKNPSLVKLIRRVIIAKNVFQDQEGNELINRMIKDLERNAINIEQFEVCDHRLYQPQIRLERTVLADDIEKLVGTESMRSLIIKLRSNSKEVLLKSAQSFPNLERLILEDEQTASLRMLKSLSDVGFKKLKLKRLVFNHVHGLHDYNMVLRALTIEFLDRCVDLQNLEELEMVIGCEEDKCPCLDDFMDALAPKLKNLQKLSLHEKTFHREHYITEKWDVVVNRFLLNIPPGLKYLAIRHNPPNDGKLKDGVEGNYIRRRKLYETVLPTLKSLNTLICPTLLQTCSCYEILVSDLLWNGCECSHCKGNILDLLDNYLMNHQYYDEEETGFKDMISPRLFAIAGMELLKRELNKYDLDTLQFAPGQSSWNFHGYDCITCFNDYDCMFDESCFEPMVICISHFFKGYVEFFRDSLPNLKTVVLTGVYFSIDCKGNIRCIYDNSVETEIPSSD